MHLLKQLLWASFSALLVAIVQPSEIFPNGIAIVALFALVPYFLAIRRATSKREAGLLGAVFGAIAHASTSYWLIFFQDFAIWTIGSTTIAYALLHVLIAQFIYYFTRHSKSENVFNFNFFNSQRVICLAAVWTVWEYLKSIGFLGYPWGLLSTSFYRYPLLIQTADIFGIWGMGFFIAGFNATITEFLTSRRQSFSASRPILVALAIFFIFSLAYGSVHLLSPTPHQNHIRLVLVQPNSDSWALDNEASVLATAQELSKKGLKNIDDAAYAVADAVADTAASADLIVWPETLLNRSYPHSPSYYSKTPKNESFHSFLANINRPLLTGGPYIQSFDPQKVSNSALLIDSDSSVLAVYSKQHPVPFAEYIPFFDIPAIQNFMGKYIGIYNSWSLGDKSRPMEVSLHNGENVSFGTPICFENAFSDICRSFVRNGADLLINITNVSWSRLESAQTQHHAVALFRTVETRRAMVQATIGGVTAYIDAEGRVKASLPQFTEDVLTLDVPIQRTAKASLYVILGDWLPQVLALFLYLIIQLTKMKEMI